MTWEDIARKLAAHPRWEWREGMRWIFLLGEQDERTGRVTAEIKAGYPCIPDLTDWPTIGVLLGMVVEAAGVYHWAALGRWYEDVTLDITQSCGEPLGKILLEIWGDA